MAAALEAALEAALTGSLATMDSADLCTVGESGAPVGVWGFVGAAAWGVGAGVGSGLRCVGATAAATLS